MPAPAPSRLLAVCRLCAGGAWAQAAGAAGRDSSCRKRHGLLDLVQRQRGRSR